MNFLQVTMMFYDAVNITHGVIIAYNSYRYTDELMFSSVRINKDQQIRH